MEAALALKRFTALSLGVGLCVLVSVLPVLTGCSSRPARAHAKIVLSSKAQTFAALAAVADARGFFESNGLEVEVRPATSGTAARDDVLEGRIDAAICSDFAVASASLESTAFRVLCQVNHSVDHAIMVRSESITAPHDLRGRRVGLPAGTQIDFVFRRLLASSGVDPSQVTMVSVPASETAKALAGGSVDAIVTYADLSGPDAAVLAGAARPMRSGELAATYSLLIVTAELARDHQPECEALVRALAEAQAWAEHDPAGARDIAREFTGSSTAMAAGWPVSSLYVSLPEQAFVRVDEEAKWLAAEQGRSPVADVASLFDPRPITALDPARVTFSAR